MKFTLIASAFAAVKADDSAPDFAANAHAIIDEQNGGSAAGNFQQAKFAVYAEDDFNLYVDGVHILSGAYNWRDASTWAFSTAAEWRPDYDTVAIEVNAYRGDGIWTGVFGDKVVHAEDWRCMEVEESANLPENWASNEYNDDGWAAPNVLGDNSNMGSPAWWRGWTNPHFPEDAEYLWVQDYRATKVVCRWNQRSLAERESDSGVCTPVMDQFLELINQTIGHYEFVVAGLNSQIDERDANIVVLNNDLTDTQNTLSTTQQSLADEIEGRAEDNENWIQDMQDLQDSHVEATNNLINSMTQQCKTEVEGTIENLNAEWNEHVDNLTAGHEQHIADLHAAAAAAQEEALNNQHAELSAAHADVVANLTSSHADEIAGLHEDHATAVSELHDAYANQFEELTEEHATQLANTIAELDEKNLKEQQALVAQYEQQIADLINQYESQISHQAEVMGDQIDELTKKHDYLYEACTTVQVVDGELQIE